MRVVCHTIDDFLENLQQESSRIYQRVVWVSRTVNPADDKTKRDAVIFDVTLHASAVVDVDDESQFLLDYGEDCGRDYHDATQDMAGSEVADELKARIRKVCDEYGLTIRPGVIDM